MTNLRQLITYRTVARDVESRSGSVDWKMYQSARIRRLVYERRSRAAAIAKHQYSLIAQTPKDTAALLARLRCLYDADIVGGPPPRT